MPPTRDRTMGKGYQEVDVKGVRVDNKIKELSQRIGCGISLTQDLLTLAGDDEELVINASENTHSGVESLKTYIIDHRFKRVEDKCQ